MTETTLERPSLALLKKPMGGYRYVAESRRAEVLAGGDEFVKFVAGYFPHEALRLLETFYERHYRQAPGKGSLAESTVGARNRRYYPNLFVFLRARLTALFEVREFATYRMAFEKLEADYLQDIAAAVQQVRRLSGTKRSTRLNGLFELAFESIYEDLHGLLSELVAIGNTMQQRVR